MKYFRFAFMSIYDNIKVNILMIVEILVILLGVNIIVGGYNNRNMLYKPYYDLLNNYTGWYVAFDTDENTGELLTNEMKGDLEEIRMYEFSGNIEFAGQQADIKINICPDEIMDNLKMSVYSGKWETSLSDKTVCIAAPNTFGLKAGDKIISPLFLNEITVSAVLTDPCYLPSFSSWSTMSGIENFYKKYSTLYYSKEIENSQHLEIIMSSSEFSETGADISNAQSCFIIYGNHLTEENIEYNEKILRDNYNSGISFSDIKKRAEMSINNILKKYIPIAVCAFIVILIGIISCTAINTLRQTKNYGTLFICGMRWSDCIKICTAYTTIIMLCSVSLTIAAVSVCKIFNISAYFGLAFQWNNVIVSIIILTVILLLNLIIPAFIIRNKTPVEIIKENN